MTHGTEQKETSKRSEMTMTRRNFWATTGAVTLIAAAISSGATLLAKSGSAPEAQVVTVTQTPPPANGLPQSPTISGTSDDTTPSAAARVFWQGQFDFDDYVSFDLAPPRNQQGSVSQDEAGHLQVGDDGSTWTSSTPPTEQQCSYQIATRAAEYIPLAVGTQACYQTGGDRIVYFKVTAIVAPGPPGGNSVFRMDVVIWDPPAPGA
jgi:hypothetical protein